MDDEVDSFSAADADFEKPSCSAWANEHDQVVELQHSAGMTVGMKNVVVVYVVLACTCYDNWLHAVNLS